MPPPKAVSNCCAIGWAGTRIAIVSWPPVMTSCTLAARGITMVSGPGQKLSARRVAASGTSRTQRCRKRGLSRWTITGWFDGRPLASKMRTTAAGFWAFAPRP